MRAAVLVSIVGLLAGLSTACDDESPLASDQGATGATNSGGGVLTEAMQSTGGELWTGGMGSTGGEAQPVPGATPPDPMPTLFDQVAPVIEVTDARPGVFIPPFEVCEKPLADEQPGLGPEGQVCTKNAISGCTEPGRYFPSYASCEVVRTQRPYWAAPPAAEPPQEDPRLEDAAYVEDMAWVKSEIEACGCVCCHDSRQVEASQWDINLGPLWIDSVSDTGLALFAGLADSRVLGAYPAPDNYGFDRQQVGIPSTDPNRMATLMQAELARRGISESEAQAVPPFGGPIYDNQVRPAGPCESGQGIEPDGTIRWTGGNARYVYVLAEGSENPGVPPNLDRPEGTLFRLDVLASESAIASGIHYGSTPVGSFQAIPARGTAPPLEPGNRYQLDVLYDVGVPITHCIFTAGEAVADPAPIATGGLSGDGGAMASGGELGQGDPSDGGVPEDSCDDPDAPALGTPCTDAETHSECGCDADYCAIQPGQAIGYCTPTGCTQNPALCPEGYSCFDLSVIVPGQPSFCSPQ